MPTKNLQLTSNFITIVIVNYRTAQLTINCLHSLVEEVAKIPQTSVVIVDNNSGDASIDQIQGVINSKGWQSWASVIASPRNGGFAYGNNLAIGEALALKFPPNYFFLLNPDTVVHPGALETLFQFMNEHPKVGIVGGRLENADGAPQYSAFRFHSILSELDSGLRLGIVSKLLDRWVVAPAISDVPCQTDWVSGANMMIRREVFETVGLLDEGYFMYYEETDFCLQANKLDWSCWYLPDSRITHFVGQSSESNRLKNSYKYVPQYWFDSRRRYFVKNHSVLYAATADISWFFGFLIWNLRKMITGEQGQKANYFWLDFIRNSVIFKH